MTLEINYLLNISTMALNKKITWGGVSSYEAPLVKTLDIMSEGVLCQSLDRADSAYDYENDLGEI